MLFGQVGPALRDRLAQVLGAKPPFAPLFGVPGARHEQAGARERRELTGDARERPVRA